MKYKPTSSEKAIIRACAQRSAGFARVEICPSTRHNIDGKFVDPDGRWTIAMNVLFVTNDPEGFSDTDLFDNAYRWSDFTKGVELTADGDGLFDFYIYAPLREMDKELQTNITVWVKQGKLIRVDGTCDGTMWKTA